jgi:hypothetical protein
MPRKIDKLGKHDRPPRIRVPNQERALFTVDNQRFVGIVQRLSRTGGSALLVKGPIPEGTLGAMALSTVFGKVNAHIEFLHTGADGVPLAQAFRFLAMDAESSKRFNAAAEQMQGAGFADVEQKQIPLDGAFESWRKLRDSVRQLSGMLTSGRRMRSKVWPSTKQLEVYKGDRLTGEQIEAMKTATFRGLTTDEGKEYENRRAKILELVEQLRLLEEAA